MGWLSGAPPGSTKPPSAASGGSGGSSGAPLGPSSVPSTGFGSGDKGGPGAPSAPSAGSSALEGSSVAANSSSSSKVSPNVGLNVFTMFKTETQPASDNATQANLGNGDGRAIDTQSPADQGQER